MSGIVAYTCPGCKKRVTTPDTQFGCDDCWQRLPAEIRRRLTRGDLGRDVHVWDEALRDATSWYLDNPLPERVR